MHSIVDFKIVINKWDHLSVSVSIKRSDVKDKDGNYETVNTERFVLIPISKGL